LQVGDGGRRGTERKTIVHVSGCRDGAGSGAVSRSTAARAFGGIRPYLLIQFADFLD
jgi:hypothetical protein